MDGNETIILWIEVKIHWNHSWPVITCCGHYLLLLAVWKNYLKQAILKWKFSLITINARSCSGDDVPALFALETAVFGRFLVPAPVRTATCQEAKRAAIGSIENFSLNTKHIEKNGLFHSHSLLVWVFFEYYNRLCVTSQILRSIGFP